MVCDTAEHAKKNIAYGFLFFSRYEQPTEDDEKEPCARV